MSIKTAPSGIHYLEWLLGPVLDEQQHKQNDGGTVYNTIQKFNRLNSIQEPCVVVPIFILC